MIKSYRHKGLRELFERGETRRIDKRLHDRCRVVLDALNRAVELRQLNIPGWYFHALHQLKPTRYSVRITGAWRITFEFEQGDAYRVDFEEYHGKI